MNMENIVFSIILHAGNAKSNCFEALSAARAGNYAEAERLLEQAKKELLEAHQVQTGMLQKEAAGDKQQLSLLLIHAEDHLAGALLARDLIEEMIRMYKDFRPLGDEQVD
jgi:PTS system cellobiose-specific IIA component